jgi:hypothetical protein
VIIEAAVTFSRTPFSGFSDSRSPVAPVVCFCKCSRWNLITNTAVDAIS